MAACGVVSADTGKAAEYVFPVVLGRLDEALPRLREARDLAPQSPATRGNLVPVLLRTGGVSEACALCDELLVQSPDDAEPSL